jgi:hypothetical protein
MLPMRPRYSLHEAAFVCLVLAAATAAPARQGERRLVPLEPLVVLDDFRAAYRKGPAADEVQVVVRPNGGTPRADRIVVRIDAAGVRADEGPRSVLLELGPLRVWLGAGRMEATHESEPGLCHVREVPDLFAPGSLSVVLPPLPLPQLAAISPDIAAMDSPTPYTVGVRWSGATLDADARPPIATVVGQTDAGSVTLCMNGQTGRLTRFSADVPGGTIELICRSIDPGDPRRWPISIEGHERVSTLGELRTGRAPAELPIGRPVPDIALLGPDLAAWSLHEALRSAALERPQDPTLHAVLILFRAHDDPVRAAAVWTDVRPALEAVRTLVAPSSGPPTRVMARSAVVMDLGAFSRERFQRLRREWTAAIPDVRRTIPADELLWAADASQTIDRFARGADAVAAVIAGDRTLRGVVRLDGRGADAEGVLRELRDLTTAK